jgi:predicted MFS family arabinose efflux permease
MSTETATPPRSRYGEILSIGEFSILLVAQTQSRLGDQLARVALALLVFGRTHSAVLTTLVYALTFLPPLLSAPALSGIADRYSRRAVMAGTDAIRGVLVAAMAIPVVPLGVVIGLLVLMSCLQPPFAAARNATLPAILAGERFQLGMGLIAMTDYVAQIIGFTLGGVLVALLGGAHVALAVDAATFVLSAAMVQRGLRPHRPATEPGKRAGFALAGIRVLGRDRRVTGLVLLVWIFGFYLAPEALAAPYAHQIRAGSVAVGVLMAADPVGAFLGALFITRLVSMPVRKRLMTPFAFAAGLPLVVNIVPWPAPVSFALWAISGVLTCYIVTAQVRFTKAVADSVRARAIGVASAGLQTAQGVGVLIAGGIASAASPAVAIGVCAAVGSLAVLVVGLVCRPGTTPDEAVVVD